MVDNIKTIFRLFKIYGKMDLMWFLRDTKYCLIQIASDTVCAVSAVSSVLLLSVRFGGFGGMTQQEVLFMLGYATLVEGVFMLFCGASNTGQISRVIGRGQLDHNMLQPVPLWIQLLTEGFAPVSGNSMFICGVGILTYACIQLKLQISLLWLFILAISVICSFIIVISVIYIVSCTAFYAPAVAEEIAGTSRDLFLTLKSYPLGGLSGAVQMLFCTAIPVGTVAWLPSLVLLKQTSISSALSLPYSVLTFVVAFVFLLITIFLFKKGMTHYATYSSPRYTGFGHR